MRWRSSPPSAADNRLQAKNPLEWASNAEHRPLAHAQVLHLSDDSSGLRTAGQALVFAYAGEQVAAGYPLEITVEWTGPDRTPAAAVIRYQDAVQAWTQTCRQQAPRRSSRTHT